MGRAKKSPPSRATAYVHKVRQVAWEEEKRNNGFRPRRRRQTSGAKKSYRACTQSSDTMGAKNSKSVWLRTKGEIGIGIPFLICWAQKKLICHYARSRRQQRLQIFCHLKCAYDGDAAAVHCWRRRSLARDNRRRRPSLARSEPLR